MTNRMTRRVTHVSSAGVRRRHQIKKYLTIPNLTTTFTPATYTNLGSKATAGNWRRDVGPSPATTESVTLATDHTIHHAGGYTNSSHYARERYDIPETHGVYPQKDVTVTTDFYLPSNYLGTGTGASQGYHRIVATDNITTTLNGNNVGALNADEVRISFGFWNDKRARLWVAHENNEELVLWTGNTGQIAAGQRHTVKFLVDMKKTATGSWWVDLNGTRVGTGTNVRTCATTAADSEIGFTRWTVGLDGAANQDNYTLDLHIYSVTFKATL